MIMVISRFKVANAMESQVREAFQNRPRLVENAAGFLGLEVFTDSEDPSLFCLITRWTDEDSFKAWHGSKAHRLSHQGIPGGLKIERGVTEIKRLDRIPASKEESIAEERTADITPLLAKFLSSSQSIYLIFVGNDGEVLYCSPSFFSQLKSLESEVIGRPVWNLLTQEDAETLRTCAAQKDRNNGQRTLLNFVNAEQGVVTMECLVDVHPTHFVIIGEHPRRSNEQSAEELMRLNNEMAVLSRENARKTKELEKTRAELEQALEDVKSSHWHLKKLQEVLPICLECGKVKSGGQWENVITFLKENAQFLSHGYCPECYERARVQFGLAPKE